MITRPAASLVLVEDIQGEPEQAILGVLPLQLLLPRIAAHCLALLHVISLIHVILAEVATLRMGVGNVYCSVLDSVVRSFAVLSLGGK